MVSVPETSVSAASEGMERLNLLDSTTKLDDSATETALKPH